MPPELKSAARSAWFNSAYQKFGVKMKQENPVYKRIRSEIVRLNRDWNTFHDLFAHSDERSTLLSSIATGYFRITKDVLTESVILTICRLTDPPKSSGKENLSLGHLLDEVRNLGNITLADTLQPLLDGIITISEPIREARNQMLAHLDYNRSLGIDHPAPIVIPRGLIDKIRDEINNFIKIIVAELEDADYFPEMIIFQGTANDLVACLEKCFHESK